MSILEVNGVRKVYATRFGGNKVEALKNVSFSVERGEYVAIMGESGSGKTTLLNILAALDKPTDGTVKLEGMDLSKVKESQMGTFRRDNLGFVFQEFNLLDTFTVEDNIYLPLVLAGNHYKVMESKMMPIVEKLGIKHLLKKYPYEISSSTKCGSNAANSAITSRKFCTHSASNPHISACSLIASLIPLSSSTIKTRCILLSFLLLFYHMLIPVYAYLSINSFR